jgi:hypothetical protein
MEQIRERNLSFSKNFCEIAEIVAFEIMTELDTMNSKTQFFDYVC